MLFQRWLSIVFNGRFNWFPKSLVGNRLFKITKSIHLNNWLVYGVFLGDLPPWKIDMEPEMFGSDDFPFQLGDF